MIMRRGKRLSRLRDQGGRGRRSERLGNMRLWTGMNSVGRSPAENVTVLDMTVLETSGGETRGLLVVKTVYKPALLAFRMTSHVRRKSGSGYSHTT